jgi:hypothetical protein
VVVNAIIDNKNIINVGMGFCKGCKYNKKTDFINNFVICNNPKNLKGRLNYIMRKL